MHKLVLLLVLCAGCDSPHDAQLVAAYRACLTAAPVDQSPMTRPRRSYPDALFAADEPETACRQAVARDYAVSLDRVRAVLPQ